jgi:hypothetical protein
MSFDQYSIGVDCTGTEHCRSADTELDLCRRGMTLYGHSDIVQQSHAPHTPTDLDGNGLEQRSVRPTVRTASGVAGLGYIGLDGLYTEPSDSHLAGVGQFDLVQYSMEPLGPERKDLGQAERRRLGVVQLDGMVAAGLDNPDQIDTKMHGIASCQDRNRHLAG